MGVQCSIIVWETLSLCEATGADHCTATLPLYKTLKSVFAFYRQTINQYQWFYHL